MTLPMSVLAATVAKLYASGETAINVMTATLAGALAGDRAGWSTSAIICLENTHRHLPLGATVGRGGLPSAASEFRALPEFLVFDDLHLPRARPAGPGCRAWGRSSSSR